MATLEWLCSQACIWEQSTLKWYRFNQDKLRVHSRQGIVDAVVRGDDDAAAMGRRIVLPPSFSYGSRWMHRKLQVSGAYPGSAAELSQRTC